MDCKLIEQLTERYLKSLQIPSGLEDDTKCLVTQMIEHPAFNNPEYNWTLDDYELGKRLGRGKFGRVFLAREKRTGYLVALKTLLKKEIVQSRVEKQIQREIEIQSRLKHPNILQLLTYFHDSHRIYLIMEFAGLGELYYHLRKAPDGRFSEHLSAKYVYQVADALEYCHQNHVIHRDIKPENLLLTVMGDVKVCDFGWSVHSPSLHRSTMCGTIDYLPPEMVEGKFYDHYVDNWCVGVLCYEFLTGRPPFEMKNTKETYKKIVNIDCKYPRYLSLEAKDLISRLLVRSTLRRLSLKSVMCHPWVQKNRGTFLP